MDKRWATLHVCIPSRGVMAVATHVFLNSYNVWGQRASVNQVEQHIPVGLSTVEAREHCLKLVDEWMAHQPDQEHWILWCDDDMDPSVNAVAALMDVIRISEKTDAPIGIISGLCSRKEDNLDPGLIFAPRTNIQMHPMVDYNPGDVVEVEWCGLGFAIMRADWLKKIPAPRFEGNTGGAQEDHFFTTMLRKNGCIPYVHTGCQIGHYHFEKRSTYFPYLAAPIRSQAGKDHKFVAAYLTCGQPQLHERMAEQFKGGATVCFDNGGEPRAKEIEGVEIVRSNVNHRWARGFCEALDAIFTAYPECEAVWMCNDDIEGASQEMGWSLYRLMKQLDAGLITPAIEGTACTQCAPGGHPGATDKGRYRKILITDFVAPVISRKAWQTVGRLDYENIGPGWGNDVDWCTRADKLGFSQYVSEDNVIKHLNAGTTCKALGNYDEHVMQTWDQYTAWYKQKHGEEYAAWLNPVGKTNGKVEVPA